MYSEKQKQLLRLFKQKELRRINILHGSVRSGKTWISLVLWAFWMLTMPEDAAYLMVAKTLTSLRRNCLDLLETLVGKSNFSYSLAAKQAVLFGRTVYLEGVNDARAESKIRGMTLQGAYCDFYYAAFAFVHAGSKAVWNYQPGQPKPLAEERIFGPFPRIGFNGDALYD